MDISIVSGTYNRLSWLQKMVESARRSMSGCIGLQYEFVLVDGGSQDGTQEWCLNQPDVRLIQHGQLLGAVKAFNDGAFAAEGVYVLLANDDIEFIGDSILKAYVYMQEHEDCGIGCFYQDRNNMGWHVEPMPAVRDGKQVFEPYGQVCLVPKWLGDHVGWWGDYLHTYGGDNELSSKVYELGFKVSPVPEAKIHDNEVDDDLRRMNNISGGKDPRAVRGHHPDSWKWGRKWRNHKANLVGPVIKEHPIMPNQVERKERVLYLPIYESGWAVQKEQKRGLREALSKMAVVIEYDYMNRASAGKHVLLNELREICRNFKPTLVLTQLHNADVLGAADIAALRNDAPLARFVNWNGDYWPDQLTNDVGLKLARAFDLQTVVNRTVLEQYRTYGVKAAYWQIGWEPDGRGHEPDVFHDLVFLASGYSDERQQLVRQIRKMNGLNFGLYGTGWPDDWSKGQCMYDFITACKIYRGAKISLGDSQWPESGFVSNRVMQALAAGGSALAYQWFRGMEELGLEDGRTVIVWNDFNELARKVRFYLDHEDDRRRIAEAGERLAIEHHSFDARVKELFQMLDMSFVETYGWRW